MYRDRRHHDESVEEMYFEMDFSPSDDIKDRSDPEDSDTQEDISLSQDQERSRDQQQVLHSYSSSIPIQSHSLPKTPCQSPKLKSEPRTLSPPNIVSLPKAGTPSSSVSPSSSLIPRILRESFSKFLHRGSRQRSKSPDKDLTCSEPECSDGERRSSTCSIISPATEEVVNESLKNGLPIIPFAYPTFVTVGKYQEDNKRRIRKNSQSSMKRSFSEGRCIDYPEVFEEEEEIIKKSMSEDRSLDSIVRLAKQEIQGVVNDRADQIQKRKESQSSYVEMNPEEMFTKDDPYMKIENFLENGYLHMQKGEDADAKLYPQENPASSHFAHPSREAFEYLMKKPPKRKHNLFHFGKHKGELQMNESMGRHFKKGNKHKDDYVFFDLQKNKDYMDMGSAKTKKWHFLDFRNNK